MWDQPAPSIEDVANYYESLRPYWHPVLPSDQLTSAEPIKVTLLGHDIVLARLNGEVTALRDLCRHFQARLSDGTIEKHEVPTGESVGVIRCRYHGWAYQSDGQCVHIPQLGNNRQPARSARVERYEAQERHGLVWVALEKPQYGIPELPECNEPGMVATPLAQAPAWNCSLPRLILSALDDYHFPWLHDGLLGTRENAAPPIRNIFRDGSSLISDFSVEQPANVTNADSGTSEVHSSVDYRMHVSMPNVIHLVKRGPSGAYVVLFFPVPVANDKTELFYRVFRNYDVSPHDDTRILAFEAMVQAMDAPVVSNQRLWLQSPYPIGGADDALVAYRDWCNELSIPLNI